MTKVAPTGALKLDGDFYPRKACSDTVKGAASNFGDKKCQYPLRCQLTVTFAKSYTA